MQSSRRNRLHAIRIAVVSSILCLTLSAAGNAQNARDPNNPTCPPRETANYGTTETMVFHVEQIGPRRILVAEGAVDRNAARNLDVAIRNSLPLDEIWFRSPGGIASQGPAIGYLIRKYGIATRIPSGWWCASACNFAFLGGPIRRIDPGAVYAVHMFTAVNSPDYVKDLKNDRTTNDKRTRIAESESYSALMASEQNDFLIKMGVSRKLLTEVMYRQKANRTSDDPSTIRCLTRYELERYNVVNAP
jgi:hypothetical protein